MNGPARQPPCPPEPPESPPSLVRPEWITGLRPRAAFLWAALVGGVFGFAVAAALWPDLPGCPRESPTFRQAVSGVFTTAGVFAGLFGLVGLGVSCLVRRVEAASKSDTSA